MKESDVNQLVSQITDYVNSYSLKPVEFIQAMYKEHPTLQQSFTRLVLAWIEFVGSAHYRFDGRNEASHKICNTLLHAFYEKKESVNPSRYLPLI